MKKMLIMCGTGVATSTIVTGKVKTWLKENGLENDVQLFQSKVADEMNKIDNYDVVISTTIVPDKIKDKVIMGVPLLTNVGVDDMWKEVAKKIKG
ncbi:PTS galactitol transporter subunit IIB [Vagococcus penaei]|uniref:PTS galactitol transporter subunit IIB n=1 Tax=Vagococcus penaei TaxID=633807 RepID=A0A1Q2D4M0_9ENTE|nr:PTS sugar transporter subunit IIB [Vagococcus penaei]AQP53279.1 PTS galactitol transporter subunit IIB [Vagococcus penaei]RSU04047.1 PTS galactitol transporter subunit IIB [Vagococcus penaei]